MMPVRTAVPVLALAAHKLRAGWRGWATLAVLVALASGAVLAAVAGAIRTDTAYPRFLAASNASDVLVAPAGPGTGGYDAAVAKLPGVAVAAEVVGINAVPVGAGGVLDNSATVVAPLDGRFGRTIEIPKMLAGRLPAASAPREIAVSQTGAQQLHLRVGSTLRMDALDNSTPPRARPLTERVVGVFVTAGSVLPVNYLDQVAQFMAPPALYRELGPDYWAFDGTYVKLSPGASLPVFSARAQALAKRYPATGGQAFVADQSVQAATVERAIRPQAVALALFALALALTALLVVGQVAARLVTEAAGDNTSLAALGMTRRQLIAVGLVEVTAAAVAGGAAAVVIAIAASPLTPIGPARLAEPSPGVSVDGPVLAVGFAVTVVLLLARVTVTAWRQAAARQAGAGGDADAARLAGGQAPRRRSRVAERLAAAGAPPQAVSGLRLALDPGRGGTSVPARSALLGLAVAVGVVAVAVTFGANLLRLVDTPRLYGQAWDIAFDGQFGTLTPRQFSQVTGNVPGISDVTFGVHGTVSIEGPGGSSAPAVIPAIGLAAGTGPLMSPTVLDGRPPRTAGEIVLGTSVLRQFGLRVGEHVTVNTPSGPRAMLVTGSAVFPYFGQGSFTPTDVGEGAETTASVLAPQQAASNDGQAGYNFALMSFTPGPAKQADIAALQRRWAPFCAQIEQTTCLVTDLRPNTVSNYAAIDATPAVLAAVLAVLGLAVLAQFTVASARRSRRDYAILKVLGMTRRDLRAVTFCQAATVTVAALVLGIPLGIAGGRWAWQLFAGQAGLPPDTVTPLQVLWMIPATVAVALLVAYPAARSVARTPASGTLRAE